MKFKQSLSAANQRTIINICTILFLVTLTVSAKSQNIEIPAETKHNIDSILHAVDTTVIDSLKANTYLIAGSALFRFSIDTSIYFYQKALALSENDNLLGFQSECYIWLAYLHEKKGNIGKAKALYAESIPILEQQNNTNDLATVYNNLGAILNSEGKTSEALKYYHKSMELRGVLIDSSDQAVSLKARLKSGNTYNNIGKIYYNLGIITEALAFYHNGLEIMETILNADDLKPMEEARRSQAYMFNNIGELYRNQGEFAIAENYYRKAMNNFDTIRDYEGLAMTYNYFGLLYDMMNDTAKALNSLYRGLKIREELVLFAGIGQSCHNIGSCLIDYGRKGEGLHYLTRAVEMREKINDVSGLIFTLNFLADYYLTEGQYRLSEETAKKAYQLSRKIGYPECIEKSARLMKKHAVIRKSYKEAYGYYQEEMAMRDSINNEENFKAAQKKQAYYEYQKQKAVDSVAHAKAIQIKNLELAKAGQEKKKQLVAIYSFFAGFVLILAFSIIILRLFVQKRQANKLLASQNTEIKQQKEEIESQRDEITAQRDKVQDQKEQIEQLYDIAVERKNMVEAQKHEIEASIIYAKRIQNAVLPSERYVASVLGEHFIMFRPHSVVSGDFYWATAIAYNGTNPLVVIAVADCTGHGVPGAFMSMLGVSFLNEIVRKKEVTNVADVLNHLRNSVIDALKQTGEEGTSGSVSGIKTSTPFDSAQGGLLSVKDGMDMSIIAISNKLDHHPQTAMWAGANNPLWIVKNHQGSENLDGFVELKPGLSHMITELKGDKMPVAVHPEMKPFTNHKLQLYPGDRIFLFTDGFPDQFGGIDGKKYKYKLFKKLIAETSHLSMKEQGRKIEKAFDDWKNHDGKKYDQVDDVTVVGLKI